MEFQGHRCRETGVMRDNDSYCVSLIWNITSSKFLRSQVYDAALSYVDKRYLGIEDGWN